MTESGFAMGKPLPIFMAFLTAVWTYSFAILHASASAMPFARYAVIAEEKLQPEPWISFIFSTGFVNFMMLPLLSSSRSVTCAEPKRPPLTMTFSAPNLLIFLAASIASFSVLITMSASFSASILFGVIRVDKGISFDTNDLYASVRSNLAPVPAARIGSSTIGILDVFLTERSIASIIGLLYTIPILMAFGRISVITDLICCSTINGEISNISLPRFFFLPVLQLSQCTHTRQVQKTSLSQLVFLHLLLSHCLQLIVRSSPQNGKGDRLFNLSWIILETHPFLT